MPKTNFCKPRTDPREAEVKALIAAGMARHGHNQASLAKKALIPPSTLCEKINNPGEMKLKHLWKILDVLGTEQADKTKIV